MKYLFVLLISCSTLFGQSFTFNDLPWLSAPNAGVPPDLTFGGLALRWNYTNGVNSIPAVITDWTDTVQQVKLTWNQAGNQPICTTTGILFKANTGLRDCLTNAFKNVWSPSGFIGGTTGGAGTNFSIFTVIRQINNNFGFGVMPMYTVNPPASAPYFGNVGNATTLALNWNGNGATPTFGINQIPIDIYLTWSNGVFWAWTNGISAITAQSFNVAGAGWAGLGLGCDGSVDNPWHGNIAEFDIFTNIAFVSSGQIGDGVHTICVTNLHYYTTNVPVMKTNGVNCIFP